MSLINDALKRAADAQNQAQPPSSPASGGRHRGPKGVADLPAPMVPAATQERPAWLPIIGIGLLVLILLVASGFFFSKWWRERQGSPPVAETPKALAPTNSTPATTPVQVASKTVPTDSAKTNAAVTNLPPKVVVPPAPPVVTNPPSPAVVPQPNPVTIPPAPSPTNAATNSTPTNPPPAGGTPAPVPPAPVAPATLVKADAKLPPPATPVPAPSAKKPEDPAAKVAAVEFPDLKLQGIIRGKKKISVIVNGKTLSLGDRIEGAFLLKIDQESVTFEKGSVKREFFLLR